MYKPTSNQTAYVTFADSIQAPDTAPASSTGIVVANASQPLPPYRSVEFEAGYKLESRRMNFMADLFRIRRPFADVVETSTTAGYNCGGTELPVRRAMHPPISAKSIRLSASSSTTARKPCSPATSPIA